MYPFLVFITQRPIFQFSVTELIGWIITHIFFMSLMALVIPRIK
ncbi:hypothetical protein SA21262_1553 [Staphylococcus aureus subsp. aureus 21262]|nr:hypothetical protein SA21262_1553 [Staphylococcus aureus subsp. aureus 21262]